MSPFHEKIHIPESRQPKSLLYRSLRGVDRKRIAHKSLGGIGMGQQKHRSVKIDRQTRSLHLIELLTRGITQLHCKRIDGIVPEISSVTVSESHILGGLLALALHLGLK